MELKTDINGLYKDTKTGGIINKDNAALSAYKRQKENIRKMKILEDRIYILEQRTKDLEQQLTKYMIGKEG